MSDKRRASYLKQSDFERLEEWCRLVRKLVGSQPYLVGSALERPDYRDVDLRVIIMDDVFDTQWPDAVRVRLMNRAVSVWGQQETGLPIDFQIQRMTEANAQFPLAGNRNAMGTRDWKRITTQGVPPVDEETGRWKLTAPDGQEISADGHVADEAGLEESEEKPKSFASFAGALGGPVWEHTFDAIQADTAAGATPRLDQFQQRANGEK